MPMRAPTPCRHVGCRALSRDGSGFCASHTCGGWVEHQRGLTSTQRGYGAAWRKKRQRIMARAKGLCERCHAAGRIAVGTDCDHVVPKAHGGSDAESNLQWLCSRCHRTKTAQDGRAGQKSEA